MLALHDMRAGIAFFFCNPGSLLFLEEEGEGKEEDVALTFLLSLVSEHNFSTTAAPCPVRSGIAARAADVPHRPDGLSLGFRI